MAKSKLEALDALAGEWELQASVNGKPMGRDRITFTWMRATFKQMKDSPFMVQHSRVTSTEGIPAEWLDNAPSWATTIVGLDDTSGQFTQLYADSRGVYRVYQMSFDGKIWKLWRNAPDFSQRFEGKLSEDGNTITAHWDASTDGKHWERDFDLLYTRKK